jgi:hypothetical protein
MRYIAIAVAVLATGRPGFAELPAAKLGKDEAVVLKVPTRAIVTETKCKMGCLTISTDTFVKVSAAPNGRAVVNGDDAWQTSGFPSLLEMKVSKVKLGNPASEVELQKASNKYFKIKLLFTGDATQLFPQVVARSADAGAYTKEAYAALSAKFFTGPLASLAEDKKTALLTFAHVAAHGTTIGSTTYKEHLYLVVDLGADENVYNELRLNQSQRLNRAMNDKLLVVLKAFAEPVRDVMDIFGLKLEYSIPHKSFTDETATSSLDKLELYAPAELIRKFADADITGQQLLDGSVVIVNSNRVQVSLTGS